MADREETDSIPDETKISAQTNEKLPEVMNDLEEHLLVDSINPENSIVNQNPPEQVTDEEENLASVDDDEDPDSVLTDDNVINNVPVDEDKVKSPDISDVEDAPDLLPDDGNGDVTDAVDDMDNFVVDNNEITNAISDDDKLETISHFEKTLQDSRATHRTSTGVSNGESADNHLDDDQIPENMPVMDDILSDVPPEEHNVHMNNENTEKRTNVTGENPNVISDDNQVEEINPQQDGLTNVPSSNDGENVNLPTTNNEKSSQRTD